MAITPASLNITANTQSKVYGNNDPSLTYNSTGLVNATVDGVTINDSISGSLSRVAFGTLAGEQVGTFGISQNTVAVSDPSNYTTSYTGANLTITKAALSIAANTQSKVYGNNDPSLTYNSTGLVNATVDGVVMNDTNSVTGSLSRTAFGTLAGEQVGSFAITQGSVTGTNNYTTSYTGNNLAITPAGLSIAANTQSKVYGNNDPSLTYNSTGLVNATVDGVTINDSISGSLSRVAFGTLAGEQVGTFGISQNTVAVSDPSNYNTTYTGANLTITKAALSIAANSQPKVYGNNDPSLTYNSTGLVNATVDGVVMNDTNSITGNLSRTAFGTLAGEQVGSFAITQGSVTGTSNYITSFTGNNLAITPASLNVTANTQSKVYGNNDPSLTYNSTGLVNTTVDGVTINDSISGSLSRTAFGTLAGEQVGTFGINKNTVAASDPSNYITTYTGANLTITKAALNISANAQSKVYGNNDPSLTYNSTGLVNATVDGVSITDSINGSLSRTAFGTLAGEQAGAYGISQNTLAVSDPSNYTTSYTGANLTITKAPLSIGANAQSKVYGNNDPSLTYSSMGLVNATVDGVLINDTNSIIGSLSRTAFGTLAGEQVGSFAITQGSVAGTSNYTTSYFGNNLAITPAALSIAANAQSKVYGNNDPSLTYNNTGLVNTTVDGVTINDSISGSLSRNSFGTLAGEQVGTFGINQNTVAVSDPSNYNTTYTTANLTITTAPLSISANAQSKVYGNNDPALTYGSAGLVDAIVDGVLINDTGTISGSLSRVQYGTLAGEQVGTYTINQGTVSGSSNYALPTYTSNNLSITSASLVIAPNSQSKIYGTNDPSLTYTQHGLVNTVVDGVTINDSNTITGSLTRIDYGTLTGEQVGSFAITQGSLTGTSNYTTSVAAGSSLTINPTTLTVIANPATKAYGTDDPSLAYTTSGLVNTIVDGVALNDTASGNIGRNAGENVGTYTFNTGSVAASSPADYNTVITGGSLNITPVQLAVTVTSGQSKVYGTNDPATGYTYTDTGLLSGVTPKYWNSSGVLVNDTTINDTIGGTPGRSAGENAGSYNYTLGSVTPSTPANYITSLSAGSGTFSIQQASIVVTPTNSQSKAYGSNDPSTGFDYSNTGVVSGATPMYWNSLGVYVSGTTINDSLSGNLGRATGENVGSYAYNAGSIAVSDPANYTLPSLTPGAFTINPATLNIVPTPGQSKVYHSTDPVFTYTDNVINNVTPMYWNNQGNYVSGTTINDTVTGALGRTPGENVGTYSYTIGSVTNSAPSNYTVNTGFFTSNPFSITPATLTVSGILANNKIFDGNTLATLNLGSATISGIYAGDTVNLNQSGYNANFLTSNVGNNLSVSVSNLGLNGGSASNYQLVQPAGLSANIFPNTTPNPTPNNPTIPQYQTVFPINMMTQQNVPYLYTYNTGPNNSGGVIYQTFNMNYQVQGSTNSSGNSCMDIGNSRICTIINNVKASISLPSSNSQTHKIGGNVDTNQ